MRKESVLAEKSLDFAVRIVNLHRHLMAKRQERAIADQILRSGTSIGANVHEAESAQSRADFIAKLSIALKECRETEYWLELLRRTSSIGDDGHRSLDADRREQGLSSMKPAPVEQRNMGIGFYAVVSAV